MSSAMYLQVAVPIIIISFIYSYFKSIYSHWNKKNVVGPKPLLIFGNLRESVLRKKHVGLVYSDIYKDFPNEKIIGIYRMTSPAVIVRDLDIVKNILIKDFEVFPHRGIDFSKESLGDSLFHCDGETWKAIRGKVTPLFTSGRLKSAMPGVLKQADEFVNHVETVITESNQQEMRHLFEKYTMATIMAFVFGMEVDTMNETSIFSTIDGITFRTSYKSEADMLVPGILTKMNISLYDKTVNKFCHEIVRAIIEERKNVSAKRNDLISILLDIASQDGVTLADQTENKEINGGFKITENVIAGQVLIFFIAGYANNGSALSFAMYYLAKHPELQDKLVAEIEEVLSRHNGRLNYDALHEMSYLDKVFCEVLRLHPLTNSIQRGTERSYKVPGIDVVIDKGTTIIISTYAIHHDEKYYPSPEVFDPERFSTIGSRDRHPCAYLPFGTGPRSCTGIRFAKIQFAVGAVKFLSKFKVEFSEKTKKIGNYDPMRSLLFPEGGLYLNILPRN